MIADKHASKGMNCKDFSLSSKAYSKPAFHQLVTCPQQAQNSPPGNNGLRMIDN